MVEQSLLVVPVTFHLPSLAAILTVYLCWLVANMTRPSIYILTAVNKYDASVGTLANCHAQRLRYPKRTSHFFHPQLHTRSCAFST